MALAMNTTEMQKLCAHLNEFALSRAVVDFDQQRFVAWNTRFLARTGYSEEEIQTLETGRAILTTDSWYLGFFARVFILAVIGYGIYIVDGLVRRVGRKLKIDSAS